MFVYRLVASPFHAINQSYLRRDGKILSHRPIANPSPSPRIPNIPIFRDSSCNYITIQTIYILNVQHWYGKCIPWADFLDISWYSKVPSTSQQLRHFSMPSGAGAQGNSGPTMETAPDGSIFRTLGRHDWAWGQGMVLGGNPWISDESWNCSGKKW